MHACISTHGTRVSISGSVGGLIALFCLKSAYRCNCIKLALSTSAATSFENLPERARSLIFAMHSVEGSDCFLHSKKVFSSDSKCCIAKGTLRLQTILFAHFQSLGNSSATLALYGPFCFRKAVIALIYGE